MNPMRLQHIATGRTFVVPAGGADDSPSGTTELPEVPEGHRIVTDEAWNNVKGAADRKIAAAAIQRENAILKAGVPAAILETDEGKALLASDGMSDEIVVAMAKALAGNGQQPAAETPGTGEENDDVDNPELSDEERRQAEERQRLATGGGAPDAGSTPDPYATAADNYTKSIAGGARKDIAMGAAIGEIFGSQDQRVLVPEDQRTDPMNPGVGVGYENRA